jgi:hypothetical protein
LTTPDDAQSKMLTGVVTALGVLAVGRCLVLLGDSSVWSDILAGLVGVAWLLRSRSYAGALQRVIPVAVGLIVLVGLGVRLSSTMDSDGLLAIAVLLVLAAAGCLLYAGRVVRSVRSPFRARWFDIAVYVALVSLVLVAGAVLGTYDAIREAVS